MLTIPRWLLDVDADAPSPYYAKWSDDDRYLRALRAMLSILLALSMVLLGLVGKGVLRLAGCRPRRIPVGVALIAMALLVAATQRSA